MNNYRLETAREFAKDLDSLLMTHADSYMGGCCGQFETEKEYFLTKWTPFGRETNYIPP
jgi:hypothetical protein